MISKEVVVANQGTIVTFTGAYGKIATSSY
jgi:hypothetical protein